MFQVENMNNSHTFAIGNTSIRYSVTEYVRLIDCILSSFISNPTFYDEKTLMVGACLVAFLAQACITITKQNDLNSSMSLTSNVKLIMENRSMVVELLVSVIVQRS